jgi:hypothetical protein
MPAGAAASLGMGGGRAESLGAMSERPHLLADFGGANLEFTGAAGSAATQSPGEGGGSSLMAGASSTSADGAGEGGGSLVPVETTQPVTSGMGEGGGEFTPVHATAQAVSGNGTGGGDYAHVDTAAPAVSTNGAGAASGPAHGVLSGRSGGGVHLGRGA